MMIDLPFELGDELYTVLSESDSAPRIERIRVRGVLITGEGIYIVSRRGAEHLLGRDAFVDFDDAAAAAQAILKERKKEKCKTRSIRLIVL